MRLPAVPPRTSVKLLLSLRSCAREGLAEAAELFGLALTRGLAAEYAAALPPPRLSGHNAGRELLMKAYEQIGRKLQKAREDVGLSQEELAKKLGCTQASLSNYELGKRRLYLADLQRIGQLLGKPITYFLEESEDDKPIGNELAGILNEPHVKEILLALQDLKPAQRKSVFDYILWQRSGGK